MPWSRLSPAELLMGHGVHTNVPQIKHLFIPKWPYLKNFRRLDQILKAEQKRYYDCGHRVRPLPPYPDDLSVWVNTGGSRYSIKLFNLLILLDLIWSICHLDKFVEIKERVRSEESTDTELETRPRKKYYYPFSLRNNCLSTRQTYLLPKEGRCNELHLCMYLMVIHIHVYVSYDYSYCVVIVMF